MASYFKFEDIISDPRGNVIPGVTITLYEIDKVTLTPIYSDVGLTIIPGSQVVTNELGNFTFYVLAGAYYYKATKKRADGTISEIWHPVYIDASDSLLISATAQAQLAIDAANDADTSRILAEAARDASIAGGYVTQEEVFTATDGQTLFNLVHTYIVGANNIAVFIDGVRQYPSAYTETSTNSITISEGLTAGQELLFLINTLESSTTIGPADNLLLAGLRSRPPVKGFTVHTVGRNSIGDGGEGSFYFDSSDLSVEVTADTQSGIYVAPSSDLTGASGAWVRLYNREVSASWFGSTMDYIVLSGALAYIGLSEKTLFLGAGEWALGNNGLVVPSNVSLIMHPLAVITYSGSGVALSFIGHVKNNHSVSVRRTSIDWKLGTDTTSTGVLVRNSNYNMFSTINVEGFYDGLRLSGDVGSVDNFFRIGFIINNKRGIVFDVASGGDWANQNSFHGGAVRIDSLYAGVAGSTLIDLSKGGNGNNFVGINLEGSSNEYVAYLGLGAVHNIFVGCRYEASPAGSFFMATGTYGNIVEGGYANYGPGSSLFNDSGENIVRGARSMSLYGDLGNYGGPALVLTGMDSSGTQVLNVRDLNKNTYLSINGAGRIDLYDSPGRYDAADNPSGFAYATLALDSPGRALSFGDGVTPPSPLIQAYTATLTDLAGDLRTNGGRLVHRRYVIPAATTIPDVSEGQFFSTVNTTATSISDFSGGLEGQVITIIANDNFTTITQGVIKLRGGTSKTLALYEAIELIKFVGIWVEI